jgi:hypothetical protein
MQKSAERWVVRYRGRIDECDYHTENTYFVADPPTTTGKPFYDIEEQWPLIEKWCAPPVGYNPSLLHHQRTVLGELGAFGVSIGSPGFQNWFSLFQGGLMDLNT